MATKRDWREVHRRRVERARAKGYASYWAERVATQGDSRKRQRPPKPAA